MLKNYFKKHVWLIFILLNVFASPNHTLAAEGSNTQSKQNGGNETIFGAFGIKFGEDITPYIREISSTHGMNLMGNFVKYITLNPPVNIKQMFPEEIYNIELLGIPDDNNRVILLRFTAHFGINSCDTNNAKAINEFLREKYKITKPQQGRVGLYEEYGDGEGNNIGMSCREGGLDVTYVSHLMKDYIVRLKAEKDKQKEDSIKSLRNIL
jgi:hypothetical protein